MKVYVVVPNYEYDGGISEPEDGICYLNKEEAEAVQKLKNDTDPNKFYELWELEAK